ncbi:MAG: hypothetical protein J6L87_08230, partial [Clostridia bacterium]|nr:hypothetical protein [Clostridia bacterium]
GRARAPTVWDAASAKEWQPSQNASKTRFAMRDAKTATGKRRRFLQKEPPLPQKGALAKVLSSCSHFQLRHFFKK